MDTGTEVDTHQQLQLVQVCQHGIELLPASTPDRETQWKQLLFILLLIAVRFGGERNLVDAKLQAEDLVPIDHRMGGTLLSQDCDCCLQIDQGRATDDGSRVRLVLSVVIESVVSEIECRSGGMVRIESVTV